MDFAQFLVNPVVRLKFQVISAYILLHSRENCGQAAGLESLEVALSLKASSSGDWTMNVDDKPSFGNLL